MTVHIDRTLNGTYGIRHIVIKAFSDLVIFLAIAGNIISYSREIFALLNSLL